MTRTAVYDANVLFPAPLRDLLIRLALAGAVRAKWSETILDECFRNILRVRPELDDAALARTRELMNRAVRDVLVTGYEERIDELQLPDPDDRHVLAAALVAGAEAIVTFNVRDFPNETLAPCGVEAVHPDDFVGALIDERPEEVCAAVRAQLASLRNPPQTIAELLGTLANVGLPRSAERLAELLG